MIKFKKLHPDAVIPKRASDGAAGFDLYVPENYDTIKIGPGQVFWLSTGIVAAIPKGCVGLVRIRSSLARKHRLEVVAGVIDSDYRGEIQVGLISHAYTSINLSEGERVAQLIVVPCLQEAVEVTELDDTVRGEGGFGSTGTNEFAPSPAFLQKLAKAQELYGEPPVELQRAAEQGRQKMERRFEDDLITEFATAESAAPETGKPAAPTPAITEEHQGGLWEQVEPMTRVLEVLGNRIPKGRTADSPFRALQTIADALLPDTEEMLVDRSELKALCESVLYTPSHRPAMDRARQMLHKYFSANGSTTE